MNIWRIDMWHPIKRVKKSISDTFDDEKIKESVDRGSIERGSFVYAIRSVGSAIWKFTVSSITGIGNYAQKIRNKRR